MVFRTGKSPFRKMYPVFSGPYGFSFKIILVVVPALCSETLRTGSGSSSFSLCSNLQNSDCAIYGNSKCYRSGSLKPDSPGPFNITLYSMRLCPYSERARLVLHSKNISYNVVNIDPYNQPQWFADINPRKQVPSLELENGTRIHGSLEIAKYVNENIPGKRYDHDPAKDYIVTFVTSNIAKSTKMLSNRTIPVNESIVDHLLNSYAKLDSILTGLQSSFFNGESMGMTDLMVWPWFERIAPALDRPDIPATDRSLLLERYDNLQQLSAWRIRMVTGDGNTTSVVQANRYSTDLHRRFYENNDCDVGLCVCP